MLTLGFDVGLSGAYAVLSGKGELLELQDLPVMPNGLGKSRVKQMVNGAALAQQLKHTICWREDKDVRAYVEIVTSMPGQGVAGMFSLGQSLGIILGVLAALEVPVTLIRPQDWKQHFGLLRAEKDASRTVASHRLPCAAADLALKKYHNRADALLIGLYGMTK